MRLAAQHADIWSCYATERSDLVELGPRITALEAACAEVGRDPATVGRSVGVDVKPFEPEPDPTAASISGSPRQIADQVLALRDGGYTMVELWPTPHSLAAVEALAPVVELVRAG
jgi:alkanesulfonate monooxygenase SsuD/methylene tetrahydromethanopterin reductase-like flavin-dependent oxidoreductase (luciferase family)